TGARRGAGGKALGPAYPPAPKANAAGPSPWCRTVLSDRSAHGVICSVPATGRTEAPMRRWFAALVMLALAQPGCGQSSSSQPRMVQISGTVTLRSGALVEFPALVRASTGDSTVSDMSGRYSLSVPASPDSILLDVLSGYVIGISNIICVHDTLILATHSQT